jgi:hypothetical protein
MAKTLSRVKIVLFHLLMWTERELVPSAGDAEQRQCGRHACGSGHAAAGEGGAIERVIA